MQKIKKKNKKIILKLINISKNLLKIKLKNRQNEFTLIILIKNRFLHHTKRLQKRHKFHHPP